jgi:uncharacterized protein (TIGR02001 family)
MKKTLLSLSIAAAAVSMPAQAADIGGGLDLSANVSMGSDYIWRGATQTDGEPTIQGGFDLAHESGFYAGTWASNVDDGWTGGAEAEFDWYVGYSMELGSIGVDVSYLDYGYPGATDNDFSEIAVGLSHTLGSVDLGATYYFGDEFGDAWEIGAGTELAGLGVSATYGDYDEWGDYYSISAAKEFGGVEFSLTYSDLDSDSGSASDEDALVFAASKSF